MLTDRRLRVVEEEEIPEMAAPPPPQAQQMSSNSGISQIELLQFQQMMLQKEASLKKQNEQIITFVSAALRLLTERFVNAFLAFLGLIGAFFLWEKCLADPSPTQLVGLGLFAGFVIGLIWTRTKT